MLRLEYSAESRPIPWLQMTWLLESPGQKQQCYWLYRIDGSLSSIIKGLSSMGVLNGDEQQKIQLYVYVCSKQFSIQGLRNQAGWKMRWDRRRSCEIRQYGWWNNRCKIHIWLGVRGCIRAFNPKRRDCTNYRLRHEMKHLLLRLSRT